MDRQRIIDALERSWSKESSSLWSPSCPALGHCGVTALVIQDSFGGSLLKTDFRGRPHFYNLIGGQREDFTSSQFDIPIEYSDHPATRDEAFADTNQKQYSALLDAYKRAWQKR